MIDLVGLDLRPAPEATHVDGLLEVLAGDRPWIDPPTTRQVLRGTALVLLAVLAPALVLLAALLLPVPEPVGGLLLVAGWTGLVVIARRLDSRSSP